ncbi:hypothetical protein [Sphingomonas jaspsi]|nr:hypothetical protein [Sphingomonas jaspsi]
MVRKLMPAAVIGLMVVLAACNTVRGAGDDLKSAANCTENTINGGRC